MTPQQIIGLGVRIFAIFLVLHSLKYLVGLPGALEVNNIVQGAYLSYGIGVSMLLIAPVLWFFPTTIANKIIPHAQIDNHLKVQALDAARVGGSLIGLWLFVTAFKNFVWFILVTATSTGGGSYANSLNTEQKLDLILYLIELALSCFLIFKSHVFAAIALRDTEGKRPAD